MKCYDCNTENFEGRKYCSNCGNQLMVSCGCSFSNKPGDVYCGGCGKVLPGQITKRRNKLFTNDQLIEQLSEQQINDLIMESLFFKFDENKGIEQEEINSFFTKQL